MQLRSGLTTPVLRSMGAVPVRSVAVLLALVGGAAPCLGGAEDPEISLNFHGMRYAGTGCGSTLIDDSVHDCETLAPGTPGGGIFNAYWAWVVVGGVEPRVGEGGPGGIGGIQFGIEYDPGVVIYGWTLCTGGSEIPEDGPAGTWPASGTGNAITWFGGCYEVTENDDGVTAIGFLTLDMNSIGSLRYTVDPRIGEARMVDCGLYTHAVCTDLLGRFEADPDGGEGQNPCGETCMSTPVRPVTWSSIKGLYEDAAAR